MQNINRYNAEIQLRISDRYTLVSAEIKERHKDLIEIQKRLSRSDLLHSDYLKLIHEQEWMEDHLIRLEIERNTWLQAREICLEVANEME